MNNWVLLSAYSQKYKALMLVSALEEKGIECKIIDKIDSAFNFLGKVEVYVRQENVVRALYEKGNIEL
ncbi:MAG: hypothetical protein LC105_13310 [Chitinophagales bacterium]|nr:hypothetical protein [Chitinophagales bacterium]MCZ2394835.1 hypothetical protein [Chitinophagales bacterium]